MTEIHIFHKINPWLASEWVTERVIVDSGQMDNFSVNNKLHFNQMMMVFALY